MTDKLHVPISKELYSSLALNPETPANSSARGYMYFTQMGNAVSIKYADVPYVLSGMEKEFRELNYHLRLDFEFTVLMIVPFYHHTLESDYPSLDEAAFVKIVFRNENTGEIDFIKVDHYDKKDKKFGYEHVWTNEMHNLREGGRYSNTDLTKTNAEKDGMFVYGRNINVLYASKAESAEDAFLMSESFVKKFKMDLFKSVKAYSDFSKIPLNLYGDADNYLPFPAFGQKVRPDCIIMAMRDYKDENFLFDFGRSDLDTPHSIHDKLFRVESPEAIVTDIRVIYNPDGKVSNVFNEAHDELLRYAEHRERYDNLFISKCEELLMDNRQTCANDLHVHLVNLQKLYHKKVNKVLKQERLPTFTIDITLKYVKTPNKGFKFTTRNGSKGVGSVVIPDDEMPVDANGLRAELIIVVNSNIHRMNIGNLTEYNSTAVRILDMRLKEIVNASKAISLTDKIIDTWHIIGKDFQDFFDLVNPEKALIYRSKGELDKQALMKYYMERHLQIPIPIDVKDTKGIVLSREDICDRIKNSRFAPKIAPLRFRGLNGEYDFTLFPTHMHVQYVFALNKISDDWLVSESSKLNPLGVPVAPSAMQKEGANYNNKPVKTSETETRFDIAYTKPHNIAEKRDRNQAIPTKFHIIEKLLNSKEPSNIDVIVKRPKSSRGSSNFEESDNDNSTIIPFGNDVMLKTSNSLLKCLGIQIKGMKRE